MGTYLSYFDMFRYISGTLLILLMLCHGILPEREHYRVRLCLSCLFSLFMALLYVPLSMLLSGYGNRLLMGSVSYWAVMSVLPVLMIRICWHACWAGVLFRVILCLAAENFMTALSYYLLSQGQFFGLRYGNPVVSFLITICLYVCILLIAWYLLRPQVMKDENSFYQNQHKTTASYLWAYISVYIMFSATKLCLEMIIPKLAESAEYSGEYVFLKYYLTLTLILLSVAITFIMISSYRNMTLLNEKQIITQMLRDRQGQYEFSRENSEMIKKTAHDLRHQLRALERVSDREYRQRLEAAERSIDYYDAQVQSGNEVLDTILTEKSMYCQNRGIRLSCTVLSSLMEKIGVVDLYTLLGNALDNSIEAVEQLQDPDKKTISLTIRDQDQMLYIQLENYYEGSLKMEDGLPVTTKTDVQMHGYGTKSIRAIVQNYHGAMMVRTEDQIFSLEILIPM